MFKLETALKKKELISNEDYIEFLEKQLCSQEDHQAIVAIRDLIATNTADDKSKLNLIEDIVNKF